LQAGGGDSKDETAAQGKNVKLFNFEERVSNLVKALFTVWSGKK